MPKAVDMGDGHEVRRSAAGKPILASNRPNKFGAKVRKAFLTHLAGSCNVRASAKAAGCSTGAVYYWQKADPEFNAACDHALEAGYKQLQHVLLERAMRGGDANNLSAADYEEMPDPSEIDTELALKLMALHGRRVVTGARRGGGASRRKATREETDAAIIKRLKVCASGLSMEKTETVIRGKNLFDALKHLTDEQMEKVIPFISELQAQELKE